MSFSTADAERPSLDYRAGVLTVCFVDWRERSVSLRFPEVVAFKWQDEGKLPPELRNDVTYEVVDSPWLVDLVSLGAAGPRHRHFKLCFNAAGVLDVVSEAIQELS